MDELYVGAVENYSVYIKHYGHSEAFDLTGGTSIQASAEEAGNDPQVRHEGKTITGKNIGGCRAHANHMACCRSKAVMAGCLLESDGCFCDV